MVYINRKLFLESLDKDGNPLYSRRWVVTSFEKENVIPAGFEHFETKFDEYGYIKFVKEYTRHEITYLNGDNEWVVRYGDDLWSVCGKGATIVDAINEFNNFGVHIIKI
jgi:hypothetical protein